MSSDALSDPSQPAPLRFFDRFEWALPTAFAGALAAYRFEQGDVLFRDAKAYDALDAPPREGRAIQVLHPPRSARTTPVESDGDRRRASWESEVRLELVDLASGQAEARAVSQGKLVMALWSGDEGWLDPERAEPPVPRPARELGSALEQSASTFDTRWKTKRGVRFLFVVDLSSDASRVKARAIEDALGALGACERLDLSPAEAGVEAPDTFHPALAMRGLAVRGASEEAATAALRDALYGGRGATTDAEPAEGEAATDRFSVTRHGLLSVLGG